MNLETRAMAWLRFDKRCVMALMERTPRWGHGRPDVIGITKSRHMLEIEIKRTMADFRHNKEKFHVQTRDMYLKRWPLQFWFLVPQDLSERVVKEAPEWAGVLTVGNAGTLSLVKPAPTNKESQRLSLKEAVRLAQLQSNQLWSTSVSLSDAIYRRQCESDEPMWVEYQI